MFSPHSSLQKVIRGGQVTLHIFTMYGQILKVMMACVLAILVAFNGFWFMTKNTTEQREIFSEYISATLRVKINKHATQALKDPKGRQYYVLSRDFIESAPVRRIVNDVCIYLIQGGTISVLLALSFFIGLSVWFKGMRSRATQTKVLNNHILETPKNVNKLLTARKQKSALKIADLHRVKDTETKHILALGTTGSGKSNLIKSLIRQIIERGDKFIVFDKSCDLASQFYHPESGIILIPFDVRPLHGMYGAIPEIQPIFEVLQKPCYRCQRAQAEIPSGLLPRVFYFRLRHIRCEMSLIKAPLDY